MSKVLSKIAKRKIREIVYLVMELNEITNWELRAEISEWRLNILDFRDGDLNYYIDYELIGISFMDKDEQIENKLNKVLEKLKKDLVNQRIKHKEEIICQK